MALGIANQQPTGVEPMNERHVSDVRSRQGPLRARYKEIPGEAAITDRARTTGGVGTDPFHGFVVPGSRDYGVRCPFGIHRALGG